MSVTVVKEFTKQDQQIETTLDNSLREPKDLNKIFFLYCIKDLNNLSEDFR